MRAALRRSFGCGCEGEIWPHLPFRVLDEDADHDFGEAILRDAEEACGMRPDGCPWAAMREPWVAETLRAHRWFKTGELDARYGGRVPAWLWDAVETYDAALNAVQVHDMREDREERERKRREAEINAAAHSGTVRR